jgi:hypothetical protein
MRLTTRGFMHTQWHQRARVPKSRLLAHSDCSRSSSRACVPARPRCLPVGIRNTFSRSTGLSGNRILPAATKSSSSSVPSFGKKGTSFATGRLRSRMMISSPPLAKVRYLLSRFLSSATLTLRMRATSVMAIIAMSVAVENRFIFRGFHEFCLSDRPASDCPDRPLSDRDFASPATSSINHSRGDLAATVSWIPVKAKQSDSISRYGETDISGRAVTQAVAALLLGVAPMFCFGRRR